MPGPEVATPRQTLRLAGAADTAGQVERGMRQQAEPRGSLRQGTAGREEPRGILWPGKAEMLLSITMLRSRRSLRLTTAVVRARWATDLRILDGRQESSLP